MGLTANDKPLIVRERLNFDLYHGTSSRFLTSIKDFGFGRKDPELFDRNLLVKLADEVKRHSKASEIWQGHEFIVSKMIENTGSFSYDHMHFTTSKILASNYARDFSGSEYLYTILMLVEELNRLHDGRGDKLISNNQKIMNYIQAPHEPILIVWHKPELSKICSLEDPNSVENLLKEMTKFAVLPTFDENTQICWQQFYFLSKGILSSEDFRIEKITDS